MQHQCHGTHTYRAYKWQRHLSQIEERHWYKHYWMEVIRYFLVIITTTVEELCLEQHMFHWMIPNHNYLIIIVPHGVKVFVIVWTRFQNKHRNMDIQCTKQQVIKHHINHFINRNKLVLLWTILLDAIAIKGWIIHFNNTTIKIGITDQISLQTNIMNRMVELINMII